VQLIDPVLACGGIQLERRMHIRSHVAPEFVQRLFHSAGLLQKGRVALLGDRKRSRNPAIGAGVD
jgi:hypothetical protein